MKRSLWFVGVCILMLSALIIGVVFYLIAAEGLSHAFAHEVAEKPWVKWVPTFNVTLNAMSLISVVLGIFFIKKRHVGLHQVSMGMAALFSGFFLIGYLFYHAFHGSTPYTGEGVIRKVYYTILITHIILCMVATPMVLGSLYLGLRRHLDLHRRLAKRTYPLWMMVSFTGIVIYCMLYV